MPSGLFKRDGERWVFSGPTPPIFAGYTGDQAELLVRYMFEITAEEQRRLVGMGTGSSTTADVEIRRVENLHPARRTLREFCWPARTERVLKISRGRGFDYAATKIRNHLELGCGPDVPGLRAEDTTAPEEKASEATEQAAAPTPIDQATVGSVSGKISFQGAKPKTARIMMDQDPVCVQKHSGPVTAEDGSVNDNGTLPNVFVYVKSGAEKYTFAVPTQPVALDQDGCMYKPHVWVFRWGRP